MANKKQAENVGKITSVVARESNGNIQITFTIPFSMIKREQEETLKEMAVDVEIPGFRKGKAPLEKVKEKVSQSAILEHSLGHILPHALGSAIDENKLKLAIYPKYELISAEEEKDWQVRAVSCELPEVNLGDYRGVVSGALRAGSIIVSGKDDKDPQNSKDKKEQVVIKALLDSVKIDIPQILIEEEANSRISNLLNRLEKLGLALEGYLTSIGKKIEDVRAEYAQQAKEAIAIDLVLSKVAESESVKVAQKEVDEAFSMSQATNPKTDSEDEANRKRLLESILRRRKALEFLVNLG
jgi:FKBP-type peptidyl-prolyl cis-trans isomerase (trigger factor)